MREVKIAKSAGFCFGVSRALGIVQDGVKNGKKIVTVGPIIHNRQIVDELLKKGVEIIKETKDAKKGDTVVIRSHGITKAEENVLKENKVDYIDATCPFVKKIHNIVGENFSNGKKIVIIGDDSHPEVLGINGWCENSAIVIKTEDEAKLLSGRENLCVVSQTTFERDTYEKIVKIIKNSCKDAVFFDTICSATDERQKSAEALAKKSDVFIVLGGQHSSNSRKLFEISKKFCENTYFAEGLWELPADVLKKGKKIGITAGASTPDWIIKEVFTTMVDERGTSIGNTKEGNAELSFAEALEESLVTLSTGKVVTGTVIGITPTEVYVNLGYKADGIIPVDELSDDPDVKAEDIVKIGDTIEAFVVRVNDVEGYVKLSKKKIDAIKNWEKIESAAETGEVLQCRVTEAVNRGVVASVFGCRVFVPASMASERFMKDLTPLVGKKFPIKIVAIREDRRGKKAIGSIKAVLLEEKSKKAEEFWANVEEGKHYTGVVKGITSFGAFVDVGGVEGLVHISQLSWGRIKNASEVVKEGDEVDVYIIEANKETGKVSLGYRNPEDDPWAKAKATLNVDDVVNVKIVRLKPFGAFAEIMENIDGLIHISQIANKRIGKPGDVLKVGEWVDAKITDIDWEKKKISLSIKELLPSEEAPKKEEKEEVEEETKQEISESIEEVNTETTEEVTEEVSKETTEEVTE